MIWGVYFVLLGLLVCGCGIILINGWKLQTIIWAFFGILVTMMLLLVNWTFILQSRYDNDPINIKKCYYCGPDLSAILADICCDHGNTHLASDLCDEDITGHARFLVYSAGLCASKAVWQCF